MTSGKHGDVQGSLRAINSSAMFAPPIGNATYCLPPAMYVIGAPLAFAGSTTSASRGRPPVALETVLHHQQHRPRHEDKGTGRSAQPLRDAEVANGH